MKRKFLAISLAVTMLLGLVGCAAVQERDVQLSAVTRDRSEEDGIVWFDDEAVALADFVAESSMNRRETDSAQLDMAHEILNLVNAERSAKGLSALAWNDRLAACAAVRAKECEQLFSHTRPNGQSWYTVDSEVMWGENLAKGYESAQEVVEAWMASPTHEANIMAADFATCSISIYELEGNLYFAQEFGY